MFLPLFILVLETKYQIDLNNDGKVGNEMIKEVVKSKTTRIEYVVIGRASEIISKFNGIPKKVILLKNEKMDKFIAVSEEIYKEDFTPNY